MSKRWTFAQHLERSVMPEPNSGCWLWVGWMNWADYGRLYDAAGNEVLAHCASWEHHRGPVPDGLSVLHKCDVRCCVNPDHLFVGTQQDNMDDMHAKGRGVAAPFERNGRAILTREQVITVLTDKRPCTVLAAEFGVHPTTLTMIRRGKRWRGILDAVRREPGSDTANNSAESLGFAASIVGVRHPTRMESVDVKVRSEE
jgi:hypothetical protein